MTTTTFHVHSQVVHWRLVRLQLVRLSIIVASTAIAALLLAGLSPSTASATFTCYDVGYNQIRCSGTSGDDARGDVCKGSNAVEWTWYGYGGEDTIAGACSADLAFGGTGNDTLSGGDGHDRLNGGDGWDTINGGNGDDVLVGGDGGDSLRGGAHNDEFIGGPGNDWIDATQYTDAEYIDCGTGDDTVFFDGDGWPFGETLDTVVNCEVRFRQLADGSLKRV